ncbi:MAG: hypothetical protein ACTSU5_15370 [Promethearchaeota archaeon]
MKPATPSKILALLKSHGFQVFATEPSMRNATVDLIARKDETLLLLKFVRDIDRFTSNQTKELKYLAHILKGIPLIVGERNRRGELEDNIVYNRNGISTLSPNSLGLFLDVHSSLHVFAKRGGFFVKIDGSKLRKLREARNISRMAIAGLLEVSKKAVENYERNAMSPGFEKYKKMKEFFGEDFCKSIDPMEWLEDIVLPTRPGATEFQKEVGEIFEDLGLHPFWAEKSPFDLFISKSDVEGCASKGNSSLVPIVSDVTEGDPEEYSEKLQNMSRFHAIIRERVLFIVDDLPVPKYKREIHPVPVICETELRLCKDLKELKKKLLER